jgi:hypothetical protein
LFSKFYLLQEVPDRVYSPVHSHKCVPVFKVHGELQVHMPELHDRLMAVSQLTAGVDAELQVAPPRPTFKNC